MNAPVRHPAVAGRFYPGERKALLRDLETYAEAPSELISGLGCVVPHAGYMYSGHVAGAVYSRLQLPQRFIMLCPNHTGRGAPLAILSRGNWITPLGQARVDEELATALKQQCPLLTEDGDAHMQEHALEVQLPFLQHRLKDFSFVPIAIGVGEYEPLRRLGEAIATVIREDGGKILIIASSDMNHYESDETTRVKDRHAIDQILALNAPGLHRVVHEQQISMCGFGPAVAMLTAARKLGATSADLIRYATSGDVSGDRRTVVGYAGIVVH